MSTQIIAWYFSLSSFVQTLLNRSEESRTLLTPSTKKIDIMHSKNSVCTLFQNLKIPWFIFVVSIYISAFGLGVLNKEDHVVCCVNNSKTIQSSCFAMLSCRQSTSPLQKIFKHSLLFRNHNYNWDLVFRFKCLGIFCSYSGLINYWATLDLISLI